MSIKYIISEISTNSVLGIYTDIEDLVGNDYFFFQHLLQIDKKEYKDASVDRIYTIVKEDENYDVL